MESIIYKNNFERYLCEKATINNIPIYAILELTPLCNMNCEMCFVRLSSNELEQKGRLRSVDEWISLAEKLKEKGTLFILLTGGEPLLYPQFRQLYLYLIQLGMIVTINTNGTLLDEEWADFFKLHPPRRINITLYGKDEVTYEKLCHYSAGYEKTLNAIRLLKERKIDIKLNGSLTVSNYQDVDHMIRLFKKWNVAWKIDTYMYPATRERDSKFNKDSRLSPEIAAKLRVELLKSKLDPLQFQTLAKQLIDMSSTLNNDDEKRGVSCRAGRSSFVVNWQGKMRPCVMLTTPEIDVFEVGIDSAWEDMVQSVKEIKLSLNCMKCQNKNLCNTCAACAFSECGTFDGTPDYMCQYTKETLKYLHEALEN